MSAGADDVLLQFFTEDFGGPAEPCQTVPQFMMDSSQDTPTSPLSWDSDSPPSSPDAYLGQALTTDAALDLVSSDPTLSFFDSSSANANTSLDTSVAHPIVAQLFDPNVALTKEQVQAIAAVMQAPQVIVKPDPADIEQASIPVMVPPTNIGLDSQADDFHRYSLSADEFSSLDHEDEEDLDELIDAAKAKRSRKKRKISQQESIDVLPEDINTLDQKQLLQLSSRAFEEYVQRKTANRDLTPEEKKDLKRHRRLIKNRESAQASRQRKKNYIEKLEAKVASLSQSNNQLRAQVAALTNESTALKQEVSNLQGLIKKAPALHQLWTSGINYVASLAKQKDEAGTPGAVGASNAASNNVKAAGVCLLVLLFSFGLFFPQTMNGNAALPFESREAIPDVVPTTTRLFSSKGVSGEYSLASAGRTILSENEFNTKRLEQAYASRVARPSQQSTVVELPADEKCAPMMVDDVVTTSAPVVADTDAMQVDQQGAQQVEVTAVAHAAELNATSIPSVETVHQNGATGSASVAREEADAIVVATAAAQAISFKPNTTYLVCNNVQQLTPPASANIKDDPSQPTLISFVIPPDSLSPGARTGGGKSNTRRELLEVTCKVVGVNVLPMATGGAALESVA